jgi:hypothetical protein
MSTLLVVFALALLAIGVAVAGMAVGVLFKRPCLRGSCGGPGVVAADGRKLSCASCPNRKHRESASPTDS